MTISYTPISKAAMVADQQIFVDNETDRVDDLNANFQAVSDEAVALAGNQTVTGAKTFSAKAVLSSGATNNGTPSASTDVPTVASVTAQILAEAILPTISSGANDSIGETTIGTLEIKWGKVTRTGADTSVDFTTLGVSDFSNACLQAYAVSGTNANIGESPGAYGISETGFTIQQANGADTTMRWFAIGW